MFRLGLTWLKPVGVTADIVAVARNPIQSIELP
jgi:hypothetical protein